MKTLELNRFCKQTNRSATEIVNLFVIYRRVVRSIEEGSSKISNIKGCIFDISQIDLDQLVVIYKGHDSY